MKARLVEILRSETVSVDDLKRKLSAEIDRIEEEIKELADLGYEIERRGLDCRLITSPDIPFAWEFPGRQERMHYFQETGSTMDLAKEMARDGCPHGTVIIAGTQTRGRGRMDRTWLSAAGGLYFTMVLRPALPPAKGFLLNFLASLTLAGILRREAGLPAAVKWPNDILVEGRKLCGMLSEMSATNDTLHSVNLGIGLNVNNSPTVETPQAVSLKMLTGRDFSRISLLSRFLDEFEAELTNLRPADVVRRWKKAAAGLGRPVTVVTRQEEIRGMAEDVAEDGSLLVRLEDGTRRQVIYGDCFPG
ncbi:MAG: biotin--[acetyl-CoA-carboxylase] ligase [Desulfosudaceae bacterium]